ncbi:MAG: hypothetical protein AAFR73_01585 [Pseudomonadota bacterium]
MRPYSVSPYAASFGNWPLGGDVTQAFKIWSDWFETVGQIGFINVDLGKAGDPDLEREILEEVGSYGRQLGQISDALLILLDQAKLDRTKLTDEEVTKLHKFREMVADIDARKPKSA